MLLKNTTLHIPPFNPLSSPIVKLSLDKYGITYGNEPINFASINMSKTPLP